MFNEGLQEHHQRQNSTSSIDYTFKDFAAEPFIPSKDPYDADAAAMHFPSQLHRMLTRAEEDGYGDVCAWRPHGRAFKILDRETFVMKVMPQYFKQTRFGSFQRQLNLYGFFRMSRKNNDHGCHYHELFLKGRPDLCRRMARVKSIDSQVKRNRVEPDFSRMRPIVEETTCTQLLPMTVPSNSTFGAAQCLQQARQYQPSPQTQVEWNHKGNPGQCISLTKALEHSLPHVKLGMTDSGPSQQIPNQTLAHQTKAVALNRHLQSAQNESLKNAFHKLRPSLQDASLEVGFNTLKKFQEDVILSPSHPDLVSLHLFKGNTSSSAGLDMSDHSSVFPNPPNLESSLSDWLVHSLQQQQDNNSCAMMFEPNLAVQMQQQSLPSSCEPLLMEPSVNLAIRYQQDLRVQSFVESTERSRKIGFPALALQQQIQQQQPRKGLHQRSSPDTPDIEEEVTRRDMVTESRANNFDYNKFEFHKMPSYTMALQESCESQQQ